MIGLITFIGSIMVAAFGFVLGKFYAETERILSDKRRIYEELLSALPSLQITYTNIDDASLESALKPAHDKLPKLLLYADQPVIKAYLAMFTSYWTAHSALGPHSPPEAPEFQALAKAQNDLVLEMRRDAFRWSMFVYRGKTRL